MNVDGIVRKTKKGKKVLHHTFFQFEVYISKTYEMSEKYYYSFENQFFETDEVTFIQN